MEWTFNESENFVIPEWAFGFIYKITYEGGNKYIGQKKLVTNKRLPALKTGILREGYTRVIKRVMRNEAGNIIVSRKDKAIARSKGIKAKHEAYDVIEGFDDKWREYEGSHEIKDIPPIVSKEILEFATGKGNLTFLEAEALFIAKVLRDQTYYNKSILGSFYEGDTK